MSWYTIRRPLAVAAAAAAVLAGADSAPNSAEVWIYGDIGESWWGETVTAQSFAKDVSALDVARLDVRLNSYGGSVADGIAIHSVLKRHKAAVHVTVDGIAASIASLIAMAGDRVEISASATMMVHAPWGGVYGNAVQLRDFADMLDKWASAMATSYVAKTGRTQADVMAWLDGQDHWFNADEAVAAGLADAVVPAVPVAASASRFGWAAAAGPRASIPMFNAAAHAGGATPGTGAHAPAQPTAASAATQEPTIMQTTPAATDPNAALLAAQAQAQAAMQAPNVAESLAAAVRAENTRQADIRAAFAPHAATDEIGRAHV